jgi:Endopolygalacturonase
MLLNRILIIFISLFITQTGMFGQTVIHASDHGVRSNSFENASAAIQKAIDACKTKDDAVLMLPGGRIDIWPEGAAKRELYISNSTENDELPKSKEHCIPF